MAIFFALLISIALYLIWIGIALTAALERRAKLKELELLGDFLGKHGGIKDEEMQRCLRDTPMVRKLEGEEFLEALYRWKLQNLQARLLPAEQHVEKPYDDTEATYDLFVNKSDDELLEMVNNPVHYNAKAVNLAHEILSDRKKT